MIGQIIQWSLRNSLFVIFGGLLLLAWGGYQTARTPADSTVSQERSKTRM